ncbi:hypothetical protein VT569_10645 [Flavobacterium psychrophilum]|uniref:YqiA/YcfP family alpha/beta fold hydrolase n=1 Tax=Flavobacterium psychrophilum TaxID=96345 RepID=UPI003B43B3C6
MDTQLYYIHGLYGSANSFKFLELKEKYPNIECLSWSENDNMQLKLQEWRSVIISNKHENSCVIASSTGCNFAYQLRKLLKPYFIKVVFINPLFDVSDIVKPNLMPFQLLKYLVKIEKHSESLLLFSENDEVLNNKKYFSTDSYFFKNNQVIIDHKSSHKFENLKQYYPKIDNLINAIYL